MKNALHNLHAKRKLKMGTKTIKISVCMCVCGRESLCLCVSAYHQIKCWEEGRMDEDTIKIFVEMR